MSAWKLLLAGLGFAGLSFALLPPSHAVDIGNGQRIYGSICSTCHSRSVANNIYGILAGGNNPEHIRRTFAGKPPMQFLASILSGAEIDDVAAYLGNHGGIDPNRIFDWAEWKYEGVLRPSGAPSQVSSGYYFRHYVQSDSYVGMSGGRVYYYAAGLPMPVDMGAVAEFLQLAADDNF